jgi:nucleoside-diphosphate-sugar epimerase
MTNSNILVTGSMGFIGTYLMNELKDAQNLDLKMGKDMLTCDLPKADVVIHLAAEPGVIASMEDPYKNARTNILGTIRLLEHYKDARFIFASSGGTIQETIESPYGLSKKTCEEYIKLLHDNYVILRFPNVYGKGSRSVIDKFLNDDIVIYGDGSAKRTYGYVKDVVRAIMLSMNWEKGLYKLGSNQDYSVLQIAQAIGKPITYTPKRNGELDYSKLDNTTPGWNTTLDAMRYIKQWSQ